MAAEVPFLDVPLRSIPFRRPYAELPSAVRTVCFSRMEGIFTLAAGDDPFGYSYGFNKLIDVSDPRQWWADNQTNRQPADWDDWADLYSYFLVTKARVWIRMVYGAEANNKPLRYGLYTMNQPTLARTKSEFRSNFSGRNAGWEGSWLQNKNAKMMWKNWHPNQIVTGATDVTHNWKSSEIRHKRTIDIMEFYRRYPAFGSISGIGQVTMNEATPWAPTSTAQVQYRPKWVPSLMIGAGAPFNDQPASADTHRVFMDVLIQWDVVFTGPIPYELSDAVDQGLDPWEPPIDDPDDNTTV